MAGINGILLTPEQTQSINLTFMRVNSYDLLHLHELHLFRVLGGFQEEINSGSTRVFSNNFNKGMRSTFSNV